MTLYTFFQNPASAGPSKPLLIDKVQYNSGTGDILVWYNAKSEWFFNATYKPATYTLTRTGGQSKQFTSNSLNVPGAETISASQFTPGSTYTLSAKTAAGGIYPSVSFTYPTATPAAPTLYIFNWNTGSADALNPYYTMSRAFSAERDRLRYTIPSHAFRIVSYDVSCTNIVTGVTTSGSFNILNPTNSFYNFEDPIRIFGLSRSTPYDITARAVDERGAKGPYSAPFRFISYYGSLKPSTPTASIISPTSVQINWTADLYSNKWTITCTDSSGGTTAMVLTGNTTNSATLTGLTPGKRYGVTVRGENTAVNYWNGSLSGEGPDSDPVYVIPASAPSGIQNLRATSTNGGIILTWTAGPDNGGGTVTYTIVTSLGITQVDSTTTQALTKTITGLTGGFIHSVAITPSNTIGTGDTVIIPVWVVGVPSIPADIVLTYTANGSISSLSFNASTDNGGSTIDYYRITYVPQSGTSGNITQDVVDLTNISLPPTLVPDITYKAFVKAHNTVGFGPDSATGTDVVYRSVPTSLPPLTAVTKDRQIAFKWKPTTEPIPITGYRIDISWNELVFVGSEGTLTPKSASVDVGTSYVSTVIENNETYNELTLPRIGTYGEENYVAFGNAIEYTCKVKQGNNYYYSEYPATVVVKPLGVPGMGPSGLTATEMYDTPTGRYHLRWYPSSIVTEANPVLYKILDNDTIILSDINDVSCNITTLAEGYQHTLRVVSYNSMGENSARSGDTVQVTTPRIISTTVSECTETGCILTVSKPSSLSAYPTSIPYDVLLSINGSSFSNAISFPTDLSSFNYMVTYGGDAPPTSVRIYVEVKSGGTVVASSYPIMPVAGTLSISSGVLGLLSAAAATSGSIQQTITDALSNVIEYGASPAAMRTAATAMAEYAFGGSYAAANISAGLVNLIKPIINNEKISESIRAELLNPIMDWVIRSSFSSFGEAAGVACSAVEESITARTTTAAIQTTITQLVMAAIQYQMSFMTYSLNQAVDNIVAEIFMNLSETNIPYAVDTLFTFMSQPIYADIPTGNKISMIMAGAGNAAKSVVSTDVARAAAIKAAIVTKMEMTPAVVGLSLVSDLTTIVSLLTSAQRVAVGPAPTSVSLMIADPTSKTVNLSIVQSGSSPMTYMEPGVIYTFTKGADSVQLVYDIENKYLYDPTSGTTYSVGSTIFIGSTVYILYAVGSGLFKEVPQQTVPCFPTGVKILTPTGERAVETLKTGDKVITADGRAVPIKVYRTVFSNTTAETAPYLIPAGALGRNFPARDLRLSGNHAIQVRRGLWQFPSCLAKMTENVTQYGVGESVVYTHIGCPNYFRDNLVADGTIVESYGMGQTNGARMNELFRYNSATGGFIRLSSAPKMISSKH